jgi:TRAP-type C4-dicarboxylate transport system permease small subunit
MSGSSTILEDDSLLSRFDRYYFKFESLLNLIGGLVIFIIVLLAVANILGRKLLGIPVSGYIDWTEQSMVFFAFCGIAYCQRLGGHIRMDILVSKLRRRALWSFELVSTLIMLTITVLLIMGSFDHFLRAWTFGDSSLDIDLPIWPAKLVVPVMLTVLAIRFCINIWGYTRAIIEGGDTAIAVPLIEDARTQADNEAKTVSGASVDNEEIK